MFVIVEGANGAGKTSLINNLSAKGYTTLSSPNGTDLAKMLRPACRGTEPWGDLDERVHFLLFGAARLDEYIRRIKDKKEVVVADRWWTSTYIYQCILGGIEVDFLEYTVHPEEKIDLVILLDGEEDILIERVLKEREKNPSHGVCKWTKDRQIMKKLIHIYRNDLSKYLSSRGVNTAIIDSTRFNLEEVTDKAEALIKQYGG